MKSSNTIIELLYSRPGWWATEELRQAAGVAPARLDGCLAELRGRGHDFDFSPASGIRLRRPACIDPHLIEAGLGTRRIGRNVICFPVLDSTNDTAADSARQSGADGLVVLADAQRKGRGRHGRRWLSPAGANILMSVLLVDGPVRMRRLPQEAMTVAAGLAVAEAIEAELHIDCELKWPNDVLVHGAKVAGVLLEHRPTAARRTLIIGIGVNVNAHPPTDQTPYPSTSLARQTGEELERIPMIRAICRRLDDWTARLAGDSSALDDLREGWRRRYAMINERITLNSVGRQYTGRVLHVDPLEGLALLTDAGLTVHLPAESSSVV